MTTRLSHIALLLTAAGLFFGGLVGSASAYPPGNNQQIQQLQRQMQQQMRQRQQQQQQLARAIQQRNQELIKKYQEAAKKQQEAYRAQLKKMQEAGMTPTDIRNMQREQILASLPRSQRSALQRRWQREDRLRERAIERAKRTGQPVPADEGELDLGGLEGLKLD